MMHRSLTALLAALVPAAAPLARAQTNASPAHAPRLAISANGAGAYVSTAVTLQLRVSGGTLATPVAYQVTQWETSAPDIAWVSPEGTVVFLRAGRVTVTARRGSESATRTFEVRANPAAHVKLTVPAQAHAGEPVTVRAVAVDRDGRSVPDEPVNVSASRGASVDGQGRFIAELPGTYTVIAQAGPAAAIRTIVVDGPAAQLQSGREATRVTLPAPAYVAYTGTTVPLAARVLYAGAAAPEPTTHVAWSSDRPDVASVSEDGVLTAIKPGRVTITARAGASEARRTLTVYPNPTRRVTLTMDLRQVAVGDSLRLHVNALAPGARQVDRAHVTYAVTEPGSPSTPHASVTPDGKFVATRPGVYTLIAAVGDRADQQTVLVQPAR